MKIGVMIQDITPRLVKYFGLEDMKGALISEIVVGSPAEKSGLKRMDVIIRYNGKDVNSAQMLSRLLSDTPPKSEVTIDAIRNGMKQTFRVTIGTLIKEEAEEQPAEEAIAWGFTVQDITPELAQDICPFFRY